MIILFSGIICETLICEKQPTQCSMFTSSQCTDSYVLNFCPMLCGKCNQVPPTVAITTTTTTTLTSTTDLKTSSCSLYPCLNG